MHFFSVFTFVTLVHVLIIMAVSIRVIQMRLPVATSPAWQQRPGKERFIENLARLASPLL